MARRFSRLLPWYLGILALPLVLLLWISAADIARWWQTGMCPGGPMDRSAAPCNIGTLLLVTVLGGWASPIIMLLLGAWSALWTVVFLVARTVASRRRASERGDAGARARGPD